MVTTGNIYGKIERRTPREDSWQHSIMTWENGTTINISYWRLWNVEKQWILSVARHLMMMVSSCYSSSPSTFSFSATELNVSFISTIYVVISIDYFWYQEKEDCWVPPIHSVIIVTTTCAKYIWTDRNPDWMYRMDLRWWLDELPSD